MHNAILFGPVTSRRLGRSLGVNLVTGKTCSLDCIYCECGCTEQLTLERKEYVPVEYVLRELDELLSKSPQLDYLTFGGDGEPTLHSGFGEISRWCARLYPHYKRALLTNATLFFLKEVRRDAATFDVVLPSLDAVTQEAFETINRPAPGCTVHSLIEGIHAFSKEFSGQLWIEYFVIPGINDSADQIATLRDVLHRIRPARVQLNRLARPPAQQDVVTTSDVVMERIARQLTGLPVEIL